MYNRDFDYALPETGQAYKAAASDSDGVLIITPEYNRTVPAVLKNALESVSRPYGDNALANKPSLVIGGSIGSVGPPRPHRRRRRHHRRLHNRVPPDLTQVRTHPRLILISLAERVRATRPEIWTTSSALSASECIIALHERQCRFSAGAA